jgi:membrane-associated phospholipid phosphatase
MRIAFAVAVILLCGLIFALLAATATLNGLDNGFNDALASFRARPVLHAAVWITGLGASPAVFAAALVATAFLSASSRWREVGALWIVWTGAELTSWTLKGLIGRPRPKFLDVASATSFSFPSGHSTMSMAVYGFLGYTIAHAMPDEGRRRAVIAGAALLILAVGFSRIFLSVHFTSDVLAGFAVGGVWCLIGIAVCRAGGRQV